MLKLIVLQLLLATSSQGVFLGQPTEQMVSYLQAGSTHVQDSLSMIQSIYTRNAVHIYCRNAESLKFGNVFQTALLQLVTTEPDAKYTQYKAATPQAVYQAHLEGHECHEGKAMMGRTKTMHYITLPAHSEACYGIYTDEAYNLTMMQYANDGERTTWFALGLLLWATASSLSQCLSFLYFLIMVLGLHFAGWCIVCLALICAGDFQLRSLQPVVPNFKLLLEQYTTTVALILVFAAWLLVRFCQAHQSFWRYKIVQVAHFRLLKFIAYCLVFYASDHKYFGWICVALLLPQPELYRLFKRLRDETIKTRRTWFPPRARTLLTEEEFEAQTRLETKLALSRLRHKVQHDSPKWEQMANLQAPCRFVRFVGSGDHLPDENTLNPDLADTRSPMQMQDVGLLEHLTTAINSSCPTASSSSTDSLYHNQHFTDIGAGPMRSLWGESRQN